MNLPFLRRWALGSLAACIIFIAGRGITFDSFYAALMIALVLGLINAALPYIISIMTFMQSILTLGLAALIMNALVLHLMQQVGLGIHFASFNAILMIAIMIATIAWFSTLAMDAPLQKQSSTLSVPDVSRGSGRKKRLGRPY